MRSKEPISPEAIELELDFIDLGVLRVDDFFRKSSCLSEMKLFS
jgi:hypothetical protein